MLKVHTIFYNIIIIFSSIKFCAFFTLRFKGLCRYESIFVIESVINVYADLNVYVT